MTECKHDWEPKPEYNGASVFRYKCRTCGIWAWQTRPNQYDGYKPRPIHAYKGPKTEPEPAWGMRRRLKDQKENLVAVPWRDQLDRVESQPSDMELAVCGADKFTDPGEL